MLTGLRVFLFILFLVPKSVFSQDPISDSYGYTSFIEVGILETNLPQDIIVSMVNILLSFLVIIFVSIILYGGVRYHTGHLNEEERGYAISTIRSGVIGIFFIIASMSISKFVLASITTVTVGALTF